MACTKAVHPRMTPRHLKMLTCTMNELIPIV